MDSPNAQSAGGGFRQFGTKFYRYKNLVKRNWWVLALAGGIGLAYQGWVVFNKPTLFQSDSKVTVREELSQADARKFNVSVDAFIGTTMAVLKSEEVIGRTQRRMALEAPELQEPNLDVSSSVQPRTYIFTVSVKGKNPEYVHKFSDMVRDEFIELRNDQRVEAIAAANRGLSEQRRLQEAELAQHRLKLEQFVKENNMGFWTERAKQAADYLADLKTRQSVLKSDLQRYETLTPDQLLVSPQMQPSAKPVGGGSGTAGPMSNDLYSIFITRTQELAQAQSKYDRKAKVWKELHPKLQALKDQVKELHDAVDLIRSQNAEATAERKKAIIADLKSLEPSIAEGEKSMQEASGKTAELQILEENVKRTAASLDQTRERENELTPGLGKNDIFTKLGLASPATELPKNLPKHLLIGLFSGLFIGVGILIFRDRADDRLSSSTEMMEQFNEPILGQIPDVMATRGASGLPLLQPEDERYSFSEAFRSLRSSLIFMPSQTPLQTLLVTSAIPNEGKSTITSNLGITMAAAGANIILVDADLRRGDLASLFDMDGRTGLSNVLRGEVKWRDAVQATKYSGLSLMPRGPVTNQSSELLLLPSLDALIEELKSEYDLVLFNTAPILATDDTSSLSPHFDGTLMVIRAQFTSARLTHNALNALYQRQVNVLGLILNCVDTEMPDYYYYRYPKYYAAQ